MIRQGLAEGVIDIIATDHAPHTMESKECEWQEASFGMLGLETAISIVQKTMVDTQLMNWAQVAERFSTAPARIGRYLHQGKNLAVGTPAHVTVIDPSKTWIVDRDLTASKSRNTPYHGYELPGKVIHTFFNGSPTLLDGVIAKASA